MLRIYEKIFGGLALAVVMLLMPVVVEAAVISIFPDQPEIHQDTSTRLEVGIDTEGERVNVVQVIILIPEDLEVVAVETGSSLIDLWVEEPAFDQKTGMVRFVGGLTGGFAGRGLIGSIVLHGQKPGEAEITFDSSSLALLHDGAGTLVDLILEGTAVKVLKIAPLELWSPTHLEDTWTAVQNAIIEWEPKEDAIYSWVFDANPEGVPDDLPEEQSPPLEVQGLGDGMHYFHIREGQVDEEGEYAWGDTTHLRLLVDTTSPNPYELVEVEENRLAVPARDESSGISHFLYRTESDLLTDSFGGKDNWKRVEQADLIKIPQSLKWFGGKLIIRAVDGAGNAREKVIEYSGNATARTVTTVIPIAVAFAIIIIVWLVHYRRSKAGV